MYNLRAHVSVRTTRWISWSCFWGMPEASNVPSRPFMSGFPPLQTSSWHSLSAIVCRIVRPARVFSPPLIRQRWRHGARSFKKIWWHAPPSPLAAACGIVATSRMWWWMSMGPGKLRALVRSPTSPRFPHPIAVSIRLPLQGTRDAKCGEVVRTRTPLLQAHTPQFLGTDGGSGQWRLPRRAETSDPGDEQVCDHAQAPALPNPGEAGWVVWPRRRAERCPGHGYGP